LQHLQPSDIIPQRAKELMAQEDDDMVTEIPPVPGLPVDDESENMECEHIVETESVGEVNGIKPRT